MIFLDCLNVNATADKTFGLGNAPGSGELPGAVTSVPKRGISPLRVSGRLFHGGPGGKMVIVIGRLNDGTPLHF
jgi:hypothetical protein